MSVNRREIIHSASAASFRSHFAKYRAHRARRYAVETLPAVHTSHDPPANQGDFPLVRDTPGLAHHVLYGLALRRLERRCFLLPRKQGFSPMRSLVAASSALFISLFTLASQAQEAPAPDTASATHEDAKSNGPRGLELGARLGYGLALGNIADKVSLSDNVTGQIPLWIDAGYRITPNLYVGAYGQMAYTIVGDQGCTSEEKCTARDAKVGANVHYHFLPQGTFDPWVGVGAGYEWLTISGLDHGKDASATLRGFELLNLQVGGDYRLGQHAALGPYASFALGQYSQGSKATEGQPTVSGDVKNTAMHEWLTFGVRGVFDL
jgi:hypothetical protein